MHPLEVYYLKQACRGLTTPEIGPVYSALLYLQRGHGIVNFFSSLLRWVRPILWSEAKGVGREMLRTGGKILIDIAECSPTDTTTARDIVSKHVTESAQKLISKLRGRGRKHAGGDAVAGGKKKRWKERAPRKIIKRDIFS